MSRSVVVHFHPLETSFSSALRDSVVAALVEADGQVPTVIEVAPVARPVTESIDADTLVLVYPTWWGGQPAALSQWLFDALPHLSSIRRLVAVTTHGSPLRINLLQGQVGKRVLRRVVLPRCAPGARADWIAFYNVDAATAAERTAFISLVQRRLSKG